MAGREVQRAAVRGDLAWRHEHVHDKWVVVGHHDHDHVWAGTEFEVAIVAFEIVDDPDIRPVDIHLRPPGLDIQLNATGSDAIGQRILQLRTANIGESDHSIG